jgi:hypothetical protein
MSPRVSPVDAAQRALDHTRRNLFPFRFERWLLLGFVAFLDQCGRGGAGVPGGNARVPGGGFGDTPPELSEAAAWAGSHVGLLMAIAAGVLLLIVLLCALVLWINSRGVFMYLEAVAVAPRELGVRFSAHAELAQSLFAWRFGLAMATLVVVLLLVGAGGGTLWLYQREQLPGLAAALLVVLLVLVALVATLAASLASVFLRDFVAPLQWRLGLACGPAARRAADLLGPHKGVLALYVALKIAFAIVLGVASLVAGCLTCCCAFLPIVAQVVLQPFFFFERAWSLCLLEQLGVRVFDSEQGVADAPVSP